jgi:hypothetical protein
LNPLAITERTNGTDGVHNSSTDGAAQSVWASGRDNEFPDAQFRRSANLRNRKIELICTERGKVVIGIARHQLRVELTPIGKLNLRPRCPNNMRVRYDPASRAPDDAGPRSAPAINYLHG